MFSLKTNYLNSGTNVVVKLEKNENGKLVEDVIEFNISSIISKRNKQELDDPRQFTLLNSYIEYKGKEFEKELFNRLSRSNIDLHSSVLYGEMYPLPTYVVDPILDMFDIEDMKHFLRDVYKIDIPSNLAGDFDPLIEADSKGTRVQTYIKDDYVELAALVVILKSVIGIIGTFATIKNKEVNTVHKEYILYQLLKRHPVFKSPPAEKLLGLIDKVVNLPTNNTEVDNIRIIEKQLPKEEIPVGILAIVVLQKLPICCIVDDDKDKNIITKVYNYVNNKLKSPGDGTKGVKAKTLLNDTSSRDKESLIESTKINMKLPVAIPAELSWSISTVDRILGQLPPKIKEVIDLNVIKDAAEFTRPFKEGTIMSNGGISPYQISLLAGIFKDVIAPQALDYIELDSLVNLFNVGFAYLWCSGHKHLALLLIAKQDTISSEDSILINMSSNKPRITKEVKEELEKYFPYKRVVNDTTQVLVIEENISDMTNYFFSARWTSSADDKYNIEVLGNENPINILPPDLKIKLANFYIYHERMR